MKTGSSLVTENVLFVPEEILCVILSWLEEKYLLRCKSVCKRVTSGRIIRNSGSPIDPESRYPISATKYRICNPATKRVLDLPRPREGVILMRVFLNSSTSSYYVVSLYYDEKNKVKLELIDIGGQSNDPCPNKDLTWRTLEIPEYDEANRLQKYDCNRCVLVEGILSIPALHKVVSSNPVILCVDLIQQACNTLNAPESLGFEDRNFKFQLWRGKPSLSFVSEEKLNVCILEDYTKQKWADTILIPLPSLEQKPDLKKMIPDIYQGDKEDLLVYPHRSKGFSIGYHIYKVDSKELNYDQTPPPSRVLATLVSVKGMRPKRKNR